MKRKPPALARPRRSGRPKVNLASGRVNAMPCPACRELITGQTAISTAGPCVAPAPGMLTLCVYCMTWCVFETAVFHRGLALRRAADDEIATLDPACRWIAEAACREHAMREVKH